MNTTLLSYNQEIIPKFLALATAKEILKDRMSEDQVIQDFHQEIKDLQESIKAHLEDKEPDLMREIKDLNTDIGLACKAAAKGTAYKAPELKAYFAARAKQSVEKVVTKGETFAELEKELS
jgi:hypothetical protein